MGKEIEVRYVLKNKEDLTKWLNEYAVKGSKSHQIDTYYNNRYHSFVKDFQYIYEWLRIREEDNQITLNYKHWLPEGKEVRTYCDEFEVEIVSSGEMKKIFEHLGFEVFVVVDKVRETWNIEDFEIAVDSVLGLGDYIEIEYKGNNEVELQNVIDELHALVKKTGAQVGEEDHGGYGFKLIRLKSQM